MKQETKPRIRLAFVGTGNWARRAHLPALEHIRKAMGDQVDLGLAGILGLREEEAQELRNRYGFERCYTSVEQVAEDASINAVALAITPGAVEGVVQRLVGRGLAILCEKPPGEGYAQAVRLAALAPTPNVVAFNRRYIPLNDQFKELVEGFAATDRIRAAMYRPDRQEKHFILHTGIHMVNLLEHLFGTIVAVRNEYRGAKREIGSVQIAHVRFASGRRAQIEFAPRSGELWEGVEVEAAGRWVAIRSPHSGDAGQITIEGPEGRRTIDGDPAEAMVVREGFVGEYMEFFQAIAQGTPTRSNFGNAVNSVRIATAIENGEDLEP